MKMNVLRCSSMILAILLFFIGCSGADPVNTDLILPTFGDSGMVATDESVALMQSIENAVVETTDSGTVAINVGESSVDATVTRTPVSMLSASGSSRFLATEDQPTETIKIEFPDTDEVTPMDSDDQAGTDPLKVDVYGDGSWKLQGKLGLGVKDKDDATKEVPVEYKDAKMDSAGNIVDGDVDVDGVSIGKDILAAFKKLALFMEKVNEKMPSIPEDAFKMETFSTEISDDSADSTPETFDTTTPEGMKQQREAEMARRKKFAKKIGKVKVKTNISYTISTNINDFAMDASEQQTIDVESSYDGSSPESEDKLVWSSKINIDATIDGMTLKFTDVTMSGERNFARDAAEESKTDFTKTRWTGTITIDGTDIKLEKMPIRMLAKFFSTQSDKLSGGGDGNSWGGLPTQWGDLSADEQAVAQAAKAFIGTIDSEVIASLAIIQATDTFTATHLSNLDVTIVAIEDAPVGTTNADGSVAEKTINLIGGGIVDSDPPTPPAVAIDVTTYADKTWTLRGNVELKIGTNDFSVSYNGHGDMEDSFSVDASGVAKGLLLISPAPVDGTTPPTETDIAFVVMPGGN